MKYLPSTILIGLLTLTLVAQTPPAATGDPFVKKAEDAAAQKNEPQPILNCQVTFEAYALDQNDAVSLIESEPSSGARYRRVLELAKSGKARAEVFSSLVTKSGQRAIVEATDLVRYGTEFAEPVNTRGIAPPTAWTARNVGDTFELEPVIPPEGNACDINLVPQRVRLAGMRSIRGGEGDSPTSRPVFTSQKITTSIRVPENEPYYLGTFTPPAGQDAATTGNSSEVWLAFLHLSLVTAMDKLPGKAAKPGVVNLVYSCYSLDRELAREIVVAPASITATWEKLQPLLAQKKAVLEHVTTLKTKSGQRTVTEEIQETQYIVKYNPEHRVSDTDAQRVAGHATVFETQNTGFTMEIEPVIGPTGQIVDLNHAIQNVEYMGDLKTSGEALSYPPQPVFQTSKITTSQSIPVGQHVFVSTLNPPGADGVNDRVDSGRTWLLFVHATVDEP